MDPVLSIPDFYSGKSVFITGATGFLGKVLVEKLLRSCPDIEKLFLLIRAKKGASTYERLQQMIKNPVTFAGILLAILKSIILITLRIVDFSYLIHCGKGNLIALTK